MVQIIPNLYFLIFSANILLVSAQSSRISLQTEHGLFVGTRELVDRSRREYYSFMGIPYAKPPIAERRWQPAELLQLTPGITTHATASGPQCAQYDSTSDSVVGSENCLFLNVFTPYVPGGVVPVGGNLAGRGIPLQTARPLLPVIVLVESLQRIA